MDQVIPPQALFMSANALAAAGVPVQWHLSKGLAHGIDPFGLGLAGQFLTDAFSGRAPRTGPVAALSPADSAKKNAGGKSTGAFLSP